MKRAMPISSIQETAFDFELSVNFQTSPALQKHLVNLFKRKIQTVWMGQYAILHEPNQETPIHPQIPLICKASH